MVAGSTPQHQPSCLEAIANLIRLTEQLQQAAEREHPGFAELARSCAQAFQDLQQAFSLKSVPQGDSAAEDRRALVAHFTALSDQTAACVRGLESALAQTEQQLKLLRTRQRAVKGYRNCVRRG